MRSMPAFLRDLLLLGSRIHSLQMLGDSLGQKRYFPNVYSGNSPPRKHVTFRAERVSVYLQRLTADEQPRKTSSLKLSLLASLRSNRPSRDAIMAGPAALIVPALKKHTSTVIVAHGLGDRYIHLLSSLHGV